MSDQCRAKDPKLCRNHGTAEPKNPTKHSPSVSAERMSARMKKKKQKARAQAQKNTCPHGEELRVKAGEALKMGDDEKLFIHEQLIDANNIACLKCASGRSRKREIVEPGKNDLATLNPELAAEWHPTKNGDLKPEHFLPKSAKVVWWRGSCGHEWEQRITNRNTGHRCMSCPPPKVEKGQNDLQTVNPSLAAEWHPTKNGALTPSDVLALSRKKAWWQGSCGHEWSQIIADRNAGNSCPYCNGREFLKGFNDLDTVAPEVAVEWHPTENGDLSPSDVRAKDPKVVTWVGAECQHIWQSSIKSRVEGAGCHGCSSSVSEPEHLITKYLTERLGQKVEGSNREFLGRREIDMFIREKKLGIEFNGVRFHTEKIGRGELYHFNK